MRKLILLGLVGLAAQLVDGGLGMAYGVTTSTLLLFIGNVDWHVVVKVGVPGAIGAFLGATALSNLDADVAKPVMSSILLVLGLYVLTRFTFKGIRTDRMGQRLRARFLAPLGLFAGFIDATGGGGWGPVGTPALLASGRIEPRRVIGSISASEFLVTVAASLGFLVSLGSEGVKFTWVLALLLGGVIAAPIAAWLAKHVPPRILGSAVGGLIVLTNARTILRSDWVDPSSATMWTIYGVIWAGWAFAIFWSVLQHRLDATQGITTEQEHQALAGSSTH